MTPKAEQPGGLPVSATDLFLDERWTRALSVLRSKPAALITDIDGTLSPIASSPQEAQVLPECRSALAKLARVLHLVVVISGRQVEEARRMVGLDQLTYIGNHGLEHWDNIEGYRSEASSYAATMAEVSRMLRSKLGELDGVHLEDKGIVVSIHYRSSPQPAIAHQAILQATQEMLIKEGLIVVEGKKVIEIRPPLAINKGTVVRELAKEHGLKGILYLGDDLTDIDAFRAIRELRKEGRAIGLTAGVGGLEAPAELTSVSDILLPGPEATARFLQALSVVLSESQD